MFEVHFYTVGPKVLHVLCHCYAAINIFIKIFKVIIIFSYNSPLSVDWAASQVSLPGVFGPVAPS